MNPTNGVSQQKTTSNSFSHIQSRWAVIALLLLAGVFAGYLHQVFRLPLKMPGRHGLEFMAIMIFSRCATSTRFAGSTVGTGSAGVTLWLAHGLAIEPFIFILQGLALDLVYPKARAMSFWVWSLALAAALVHAIKPLLDWVLMLSTNFETDSLVSGLAYPLSTHLLFGFVGGLCGALAWKTTQKYRRS